MRSLNSLLTVGLLVAVGACSTTGTKSSDSGGESIAESAVVALPSKVYDVKILRDTWGVPHIFGKTDPDVGFGLAYAHCEDDFKNIQDTMIATRSLATGTGTATVAALADLYRNATELADQSNSVR